MKSVTVDPKYSKDSYDLRREFLGTELHDRAKLQVCAHVVLVHGTVCLSECSRGSGLNTKIAKDRKRMSICLDGCARDCVHACQIKRKTRCERRAASARGISP